MQACILIRALPSKVTQVLVAIDQIKAISKSFPVYGRYDIVVFIDDANTKTIQQLTREINAIKGIKATETILPG